MTRQNVIYAAAILALLTASALAWAVSHPCDCDHETEAIEVSE